MKISLRRNNIFWRRQTNGHKHMPVLAVSHKKNKLVIIFLLWSLTFDK